jgi:hypothetical protein
LLITSVQAKQLWPGMVCGAAALASTGSASPEEAKRDPSSTLLKPPTLVDELVQWLRADGSQYRNSPDKIIAQKFQAASSKSVSDETIRKARTVLGLPPRPKRSQTR